MPAHEPTAANPANPLNLAPPEAVDAFATDTPLPAELTGTTQSWFTQYRRFPVFSRAWNRGRRRVWSVWLVVVTLLVIASLQPAPESQGSRVMAIVAIVMAFLNWFGLPLLMGPAMAGWVRRRRWPVRREMAALLVVMALAVGAAKAVDHFLRPPVKQALNDWIEGPGKPVTVVSIGGFRVEQLTLQPGGAKQELPARQVQSPDQAFSPLEDILWELIWPLLMAWWAGAIGLVGLARERRGLRRLQHRRQLAAAQEARREAETRLAVLQAQVEPHFLFNTLAGVRGAIGGDPARAVEMVDRLVDYLRASIPRLRSQGTAAEATVAAQCEIARAYLALMRTRLPRLDFAIDVPADLRAAHCPPLMLISLVENAVKHGIEPKLGPGRIELEARRGDATTLAIEVRDDGVGFAAETGSGLGLVNLRERLAHLYGPRAALELAARPGGGVCARLTLPLELPHDAGA